MKDVVWSLPFNPTDIHQMTGPLRPTFAQTGISCKAGHWQMASAIRQSREVRNGPIVLQKSFCIAEHKFSGPWGQHSKNYLGDYIIVSGTRRRLRQCACEQIDQ